MVIFITFKVLRQMYNVKIIIKLFLVPPKITLHAPSGTGSTQ